MRPRSQAVSQTNAGIAQLVEHDLAKVGVASSSLVSRSIFNGPFYTVRLVSRLSSRVVMHRIANP